MAGHSKWSNIKHRKARQDAVKGKAWSKCSRAIIVAAKSGGSDPEMNLGLRYAIEEAKAANMAKDTIAKAIKKGAGELSSGETYEEMRYEGYGANGVAVIVDCLTDNVNRTAPEMRKIFEKAGGNLAKQGAVSFGFKMTGIIIVEAAKTTEEQIMEVALECGADDVSDIGEAWEIVCSPGELLQVNDAIVAAGVETASAERTMVPSTVVEADAVVAAKVMRLVDALEFNDDVQKVYHNAEISDEIMAELG